MDVEDRADLAAGRIAAAIGEPARARILYSLLDGRARTSTELAAVGDVAASTASVHLQRLAGEGLVAVVAQGRHRYYRLAGPAVASVLEGLSVLAGGAPAFAPSTPDRLRVARTCYDHMAGLIGVALYERCRALGWLTVHSGQDGTFDVTARGTKAFEALGLDVSQARALRRRFGYECLDWSERRAHAGGALAAELLTLALRKRWVSRHDDSRALSITNLGRRELHTRFGIASSILNAI